MGKISALAAAAIGLLTHEFEVNESSASKKVTGTQIAALMSLESGWRFLGTATNGGAAATVGPIIWTGTYKNFMFEYLITGYSGSNVARLLCGAASISTTAQTNGNNLMSGVTLVATSVSCPGMPLAGVVSNLARAGSGYILGPSGSFKQLFATGHSGNPAVGTSPTQFHGSSFFSDLGTNLPLQRVQMTTYALLTGTSASGTMNAGSRLTIWGRNDD